MAEAQTCTAIHEQETKPIFVQNQPQEFQVISVFPKLTEEEKRRTREDITRQLLALMEEQR